MVLKNFTVKEKILGIPKSNNKTKDFVRILAETQTMHITGGQRRLTDERGRPRGGPRTEHSTKV